jgi:thymidylate kinase
MSDQQEISRLVSAVFRAWQQAQINFLVLRNYEELPHYTSNDIDVLMAPTQLRRAERTLLVAASESGFRLHNRAEFATLAFFLSSRTSNVQTHIDLFTALKWRGFDFLDCSEFLARRVERGLFAVPHPAHEAATNLLAYMIYTGKVKPKYKASITTGFRANPDMVNSLLTKTYGSKLARFLVDVGSQEKWSDLEASTPALRRALVARQACQPFRLASSILTDARRVAKRLIRPPGFTVALCGADGSGKSTAQAGLTKGLAGTFSEAKGKQFHWKPVIFSAKRQAARGPATHPHNETPRNVAASLLYFAVHWLEFLLGSIIRFRPITFRAGLALIDRYYYDFFVDQRRYRLQVPQWLVRLGYWPITKPDLVMLLDAPPEVLQSRKQEVSFQETERQCKQYRELVGGLKNGRIIDATQTPDKVAADMVKQVLDFLEDRTRRRGKLKPIP